MADPQIITIPCLEDNYAFLLHDPETGATACVDVPEAAPILAELEARGWSLSDILITHHHWDHIDGVPDLVKATGAKVWGAKADAHRLPPLDHGLVEGDEIAVGALRGEVIDVSGHSIGHIAFHVPDAQAVFTADSLMALGCGRLFEGTPAQMYESLQKLAALPAETIVYSGHEYTATNARFALTIEPENPDLISRVERITAARAAGEPTVPSALSEELATNPFLRADHPAIAANLNLTGADPVEVFTKIRAQKDAF
ncbi:hydroxyacylglutathione hydrolase [Gymnodinialimonas ceratoperidinii]|uniref:Hydroxyacylglutathione hydrolase n=1 Tax=Gymnodinialimonas ceratoperidinii TaxID=2856823 RepID=A0A8F6TWL9_9RHOB|nr:hydroxyacylglutathione hydrolase [Gymnodinialimonas ceratoperidinii]QXT39269.1 hydroxyacylglutathione hydrolase [Gymnodinialimonas ceratoperidinii]